MVTKVWRRCRHWLRKHKKTVGVCSAVIVLASFVVKEALDERLKERLSRVDKVLDQIQHEMNKLSWEIHLGI